MLPTFVEMNNTTMKRMNKWWIVCWMTVCTLIPAAQAQLYPGDANHNGRVDHYDLLYIGYAYGAIGPVRPESEIIFVEQFLPLLWERDFPGGGNFGFADANGNGLVEWGDFLSVYTNYGNTTDTVTELVIPEGVAGVDQPLTLQTTGLAMQVSEGYELDIPLVLGTEAQPVQDFNGLAFTLVYNDNYISSFSLDFSESWPNTDSALFYFQHAIPGAENGLDAALTRFGPDGISGYGEIAKLHIVIEDDLIHLLPADRDSTEVVVELRDIMLVNSNFEMIPVAGGQMTLMVYRPEVIIAVPEVADEIPFQLYPNPATHSVQLTCELELDKVEIFTAQGQLWKHLAWEGGKTQDLQVEDWPAGCYWVCAYTSERVGRQKLLVTD